MPTSANGGRSLDMALFMDVHDIEGGVSAADVAAAHDKDLATQERYGVNYVHYWSARRQGRSSASSRPVRPTTPGLSTVTPMGSWPTRSTRWSRDEGASRSS